MNRCYTFSRRRFIRCPPCHLAVEDLLTQLLRRYTPTIRRIIWCWRTPRQNPIVRIFETVGWTTAPLSVHPVLKLQSCVSVLIQMKRRIDRRIIRCYCLRCSSSAIHPAHLETGPSVHPTVSTSIGLLRSVPTLPTLCTDGTVSSSDGVLSFSFLSCFWPFKNRLSYQFGMWYFCILGT
jgi:hypothetical protein